MIDGDAPNKIPQSRPVAMVTGAAGGLGSAIVELLQQDGWAVAGVDISLNRTAVSGHKMAKLDVTDASALRHFAHSVRTTLGPISLVICAAAIHRHNDIEQFDAQAHAEVFEVNYGGAVNTIAATLPEMIAQGEGRLVIVSSLAAYRHSRPDLSGYAASKAALVSLADGLDHALGESGVRVRLVAPGFIDTPLMRLTGGNKRLAMSPNYAAKRVIKAALGSRYETRFPFWQAGLASLLRRIPKVLLHHVSDKP